MINDVDVDVDDAEVVSGEVVLDEELFIVDISNNKFFIVLPYSR